jgi:hypothetical protein
MDVLYLWTFCGRTFCRGGRFVSMDVLYRRTFCREGCYVWKDVLWMDVSWKDVLY